MPVISQEEDFILEGKDRINNSIGPNLQNYMKKKKERLKTPDRTTKVKLLKPKKHKHISQGNHPKSKYNYFRHELV